MGIIFEMMREDARKEVREYAIKERDIEIARKLLKRGMSVEAISEDTCLDEATIRALQTEIAS